MARKLPVSGVSTPQKHQQQQQQDHLFETDFTSNDLDDQEDEDNNNNNNNEIGYNIDEPGGGGNGFLGVSPYVSTNSLGDLSDQGGLKLGSPYCEDSGDGYDRTVWRDVLVVVVVIVVDVVVVVIIFTVLLLVVVVIWCWC